MMIETNRQLAPALTLQAFNAASAADALAMLDGLYEHSPWIVAQALPQRPFASLAALKYALAKIVEGAGIDAQLSLIRAHPELAGKAMVSKSLTAESTNEQSKAGLTQCTPQEFARIQQLNSDYNARFGFPFILAVRGPRGVGLSKQTIIATFAQRLNNAQETERLEALRNIHRIAEIRLNDKFNMTPTLGNRVWDGMDALAHVTDTADTGGGKRFVSYLASVQSPCAREIVRVMLESGFDTVEIDTAGNVVGRYLSRRPAAKTLLAGALYDKDDSDPLAMYVPICCVGQLHSQGIRLPFHIEVVGFADKTGATLCQRMQDEGRDVGDYLGFVEVRSEAGPVLQHAHLPLAVTSAVEADGRQWRQHLEAAVISLGVPLLTMPIGNVAGAMILHEVVPQAILLVRGTQGDAGDSSKKNTTSDDIALAIEACTSLMATLANDIGNT